MSVADDMRPQAQISLCEQADRTELPKRILHVTEAPLGGVIAYLEEVLSAQGVRTTGKVALIAPEINRSALETVGSDAFSFHGYSHRRGSPLALARLAAAVLRQVRREPPDILHVHSTIAGLVVRTLGPLLPRKTRIVYCPHGWAFAREDREGAKSRAIAAVERRLSKMCDRIVCISEYERDQALRAGIAPERLCVIENGIAPRPAAVSGTVTRPATGPKLLAFAGRFDRQKGFDTFCEVLRLLGPEARGVAIGSSIVSRQDVADMPKTLEILGWQPRDEVFRLYARADVLLVPSRWEGFGLVAIEAMQAGLAVFATRVGGLQDIVQDEVTGRLFEIDTPARIAESITATSRERFADYGRNGYRRYVERYTADRMNDGLARLYRELSEGIE